MVLFFSLYYNFKNFKFQMEKEKIKQALVMKRDEFHISNRKQNIQLELKKKRVINEKYFI